MLEDDRVVVTKQTVSITSNAKQYDESKGKRGRDDQNKRGKRDSIYTRRIGHRNEAKGSGDRAAENPRQGR